MRLYIGRRRSAPVQRSASDGSGLPRRCQRPRSAHSDGQPCLTPPQRAPQSFPDWSRVSSPCRVRASLNHPEIPLSSGAKPLRRPVSPVLACTPVICPARSLPVWRSPRCGRSFRNNGLALVEIEFLAGAIVIPVDQDLLGGLLAHRERFARCRFSDARRIRSCAGMSFAAAIL